jgi:tol-pal system protein YbgF
MTRTIAIAGAILLALALTACGPSSDVTQMENNESALREMVANDRSQIEELQEKLKQQNDRLAEIEHSDENEDNGSAADRGESPAASPAASPSEAMTPVAAASPDMGQASPGATPDVGTEAAAGASPAADSDESPDADTTPAASPTPGPEVAAITPPSAPAPPPGPVSPAPTWQEALNQELAARHNDPAARLYRSGLTALKAGKFKPALASFQDLQRRYPKSSLSEPAEYFSGNALFELGQDEKSILQFNDLTMRFPEGRFASAALLREAQAFVKINDQIDARLTLQKLLNDHPSAPEAPTAKSMMDSLSS